MATLYGLSYSPWTWRARRALDHHRVDYTYREHTPLLGERKLRRLAGRRHATVPLLVDGELRIGDSLEIIQHADRVGRGASLDADAEDVLALARRVDGALHRVRMRVTVRTLTDRDALREAASTAVPDPLAGLARPVAAWGARHIARKYGFDAGSEVDESLVAEVLREVRDALGQGPFISDQLSARDLLAASLVHGLRPPDGLALRPATRRIWTSEPLAAEFEDLLEWRDRLLAQLP